MGVDLICFFQEPDDQDAHEDQDTSPPEDTSLYPNSPGTQFQQVITDFELLYCLVFINVCKSFK